MQVVTLGGAAAWPNPGQGCSSYLIRHGDEHLLLDCGPDTLQELRRHADLAEITAIVISHLHADHILDLVTYRYALTAGPWAHAEEPIERIPLWLPPGGIRTLNGISSAIGSTPEDADKFWDEVFDVREYAIDTPLQAGTFRIAFSPTQHYIPCQAMRVSVGNGRDLAYTADTGEIESLIPFFQNAQVLIAEATLDDHDGVPPEKRGHLIPEEAGELAERASVRLLVLTHLWTERPTSSVLDRARSRFSGSLAVAVPGAIFDV